MEEVMLIVETINVFCRAACDIQCRLYATNLYYTKYIFL